MDSLLAADNSFATCWCSFVVPGKQRYALGSTSEFDGQTHFNQLSGIQRGGIDIHTNHFTMSRFGQNIFDLLADDGDDSKPRPVAAKAADTKAATRPPKPAGGAQATKPAGDKPKGVLQRPMRVCATDLHTVMHQYKDKRVIFNHV